MNREDLEYYGIYAPVLIEKQKMILDEVNRILESLTPDPEQAPAEHIISRIKSPQSLEGKLKRQNLPAGPESGLKNLMDLIGVRIVTHFAGDVYAVLGEIEKSSCWETDQIKDYIKNPKPNGYRSLHVIIKFPVNCPGLESMKAEIQLRTIAQDCWACLEHQLKYKKDIKNTELIVSELKRCADEMASTDLTMQTIRELIQRNS